MRITGNGLHAGDGPAKEDTAAYAHAVQDADDSLGVFQVESRAQMNMPARA